MSQNGHCNFTILRASAGDAHAIASLYRAVYPPLGDLPIGSGYPFPQYMREAWLADALTRGDFHWVLAKRDGQLIGCLGAAVDISFADNQDRVAELTGLVVCESARREGVGAALLQAMSKHLEDAGAVFLLAETRTGNLGGYKGVIKAGFTPIGFEPFAHYMVGSPEHMIMTAKILPAVYELRDRFTWASAQVREIAEACFSGRSEELYRSDKPFASGLRNRFGRNVHGRRWSGSAPQPHDLLRIERVSDSEYKRCEALSEGLRGHASGVIALKRIQGISGCDQRFGDRYYLLRRQRKLLGIAKISLDLQDRRARILRLDVQVNGLQVSFLRLIVEDLRTTLPSQLSCTVVDVRADAAPLHLVLGQLGFFPTTYYPGLAAAESGRVDVVQFTQLCCPALDELPFSLSDLGENLRHIVETVMALRERAYATVGGRLPCDHSAGDPLDECNLQP